jgi:hypothetical protein
MRSEWRTPLLLTLGWRNLWRHTRRTLMILFAFALGVWSMIVIAAITRGSMEQQLDKSILHLTGHMQMHVAAFRDDPVIEHRFAAAAGAGNGAGGRGHRRLGATRARPGRHRQRARVGRRDPGRHRAGARARVVVHTRGRHRRALSRIGRRRRGCCSGASWPSAWKPASAGAWC